MKILWDTLRVTYCKRFGQIAVERGYVTADQLKEALAEQVDDDVSGRPHRLLGTIFLEKDWMTAQQVELTMNEMFRILARESASVRVSPSAPV